MRSAVRLVWVLFAFCSVASSEQVVISKIMYHPAGTLPEYIELYNNTATPFDMANWKVRHAVEYEFPSFTTNDPGLTFLRPFERIVLSDATASELRNAYGMPDAIRVYGPWKGKLKNGEDRITLKDKNEVTVCTVKYADRGHWPRSADGVGHALVLKNPNRAVDDWRNWTATDAPGGSPGQTPLPRTETPIADPTLSLPQGLTLLNYTDTWRFDDTGRDLGFAWYKRELDDSTWPSGQGLFGFSKDKPLPRPGLKTGVRKSRQITYYFRKEFVVTQEFGKLKLAIDQIIDDGAVYYLNGKELARVRMPGGLISYKTPAAQNVREPVEEINAVSFDANVLLPGTNFFAVEVHQDRTNSSDVAFALRLRAYAASSVPIVLNELALLPNNGGFVEFFNHGSEPVNLKDFFVTDAPENLRKAQIHGDLITAPGGWSVLDFAALGLHPSNSLSVYLLEPDGATLVDAAGASFASDMRPIGRKLGSEKSWFRFPEATRGRANSISESAPPIRLNEIHFARSGIDWIEVYNPLRTEASMAGLFLSVHRDLRSKAKLSGKIAPHGFLTIPIAIPAQKEEVNLYLVDAQKRVLDSRTFTPRNGAGTFEAFPNGGDEWYWTPTATHNGPNAAPRNLDVVINEVMFDPPKSSGTPEFIELFNRAKITADLSNWELTDAVRFKFPRGTLLRGESFLVVASDPARMKQIYGDIPVIGNFTGKLHNLGDLVRLIDDSGNLVNQVDFKTGGDWPSLTRSGGSSMELINPWMNNGLSSAWRASEETTKSTMRRYACTGTYEELHVKGGPTDYKELHFHLVGEGHVALENIMLRKLFTNIGMRVSGVAGTNLIVNGTKLSDDGLSAKGWLIQGTHWASGITNGQLHLISDGRGDNRPNRAEIDVTGMKKGDVCELQFDARWVSGNPRLIAQTWDHSIAGSFLVDVPAKLGTPGQQNSCYQRLPAPQVEELAHSPAVPHTTNEVTITARVEAATPPASVELAWRLDNERDDAGWTNVVMHDDGLAGDATAADGIYTVRLPGDRKAGQIVQFYVVATSGAGATSLLPRDGPEAPAMFVTDNRKVPRDLRTARFIVSAHDIGAMADGNTPKYQFKYPRHSNRYFNATFISNEQETFYGGKIRNSGSPWTRGGGLDRPKFKLPDDRRFRSHGHFYFDNDPAGGNFHNRVTRYWLYLMGHPACENEITRVVVNNYGIDLREDTEPNHNDFLNRSFAYGSKGQLYRIDDEWWFTDNWDRDQRDADWSYKGTDNPGRYRSEWMKRTNEAEDDFSDLIRFFKLVSSEKYTQAEIELYLDTDSILRYSVVRAYIADWDTFTMGRGKNAFFYQHATDGRFQFLQWDSDLAFGDPNSGFTGGRISSWVERPYNRRLHDYYLAEFNEKYTHNSPRFSAWLEEEENASASYSINTNMYLSWCSNREPAVLRYLGENYHRPLAITPPREGKPVTNEFITLAGTAPITMTTLRLEQQPSAAVVWKDVAHWRFTNIHLQPGPNIFTVKGLNKPGQLMEEARISITRTNLLPKPPS